MVRVIKIESPEVRNVLEMKDGEVGVIETWGGSLDDCYVGLVVHRQGDDLIQVGRPRAHCWEKIFRDMKHDVFEGCEVRVFRPGERVTLEIQSDPRNPMTP